MRLRYANRTFAVQVLGLLLLWCLAIYTIYQIRTMSFQTLNIPQPQVEYRLIIHQPLVVPPPQEAYSDILQIMNTPASQYGKQYDSKNPCGKLNPLKVEYYQQYWQSLTASDTKVRILNAYLDAREENPDVSTVRVLTMIEKTTTPPTMYCQLWFKDTPELIVVMSHNNTNLWYGEDIEAIPYLINCAVPYEFQDLVPVAVSLVEYPCDNATNIMKIIYDRYEEKKPFAVCVKGLDNAQKNFTDNLIEWIEMLHLLGADNVFFYDLGLHPDVKLTLEHYQRERKVHVSELKLAQGSHKLAQMQKEIIPYTDCFYKHMYEFKHVVILDIDEILLPTKLNNTWDDLVHSEPAFYKLHSFYFARKGDPNGVPGFMEMFQNIYRKKDMELTTVKTFFNTDKILTLHNDLPVKCLNDCSSRVIEVGEAQLQHYHDDCKSIVSKSCVEFGNVTVVDKTIWNYKDAVLDEVVKTRKRLRLL